MKQLNLPVKNREELRNFKAGEEILVSGTIYTARDKVHATVARGDGEWPFELLNNGIFYSGPTASTKNFPLGSCGPTTSARMDNYTPELYKKGLAVTVGKGPRNAGVIEGIKEYGGMYLVAYGGCGALYGSKVICAEIIAYEEFGPQAVYKLNVKDFPVIVGVDFYGKDIFNDRE
jgi:fumarate hydratase subunit beta